MSSFASQIEKQFILFELFPEKIHYYEIQNGGPMGECTHKDQIEDVTSNAEGCEECLKTNDTWVHLRICKICGKVGCCDSSVNKHARKHWEETGHPIIQSYEEGEEWYWCYIDETFFREK